MVGHAQIGTTVVRSKTGKYMLYQPYLVPNDFILISRNHDNLSTGAVLFRLLNTHFDKVFPYIEAGLTHDFKSQRVFRTRDNTVISRSMVGYQWGIGAQLFNFERIQGNLSYTYTNGERHISCQSLNIQIRCLI